MCTRYITPDQAAIEREWELGRHNNDAWLRAVFGRELFPRQSGPFIRRTRDDAGYSRELVVGRWGLIPPFSATPDVKFATWNARSEDMARKASFKEAWARGQRCIVPATVFFEPNWETGRNVWWRFARRDGAPWGVAGLWHRWVDRKTGELHESYTMLTLGANEHPLMGRMHKPELDPATRQPLPPDQQDKRSLIAIEHGDIDQWLAGTVAQAQQLLRLTPAETFDAGPEHRPAQAPFMDSLTAPRAAASPGSGASDPADSAPPGPGSGRSPTGR
jgi:putative SOS response-associated peptidase YedK